MRRLLVEAAWHHRSAYRPAVALRRPGSGPAAARARAHADNQRLHARWVDLNLRRKRAVIANVAVARELAGWCWSLAVLPD
ncbi:transposase-like domain protein [Mycobacterium kansasii 824]|uniref:Transposase-like domain protein n=1 Tax=Mycobacterium kansasii TaxID=1768 RepID=A0A1V3X060_MYCKA|nr:transposase-like domain protein [Mycobacterium kansasii 824]OOK71881.1 transposase-like domain protein [Mycobacterium kansasii]